jgi:hypothetical protein
MDKKHVRFLFLLGLLSLNSACASPVGSIDLSSETSGSSGTGQTRSNYSQRITWSFPTPSPSEQASQPPDKKNP